MKKKQSKRSHLKAKELKKISGGLVARSRVNDLDMGALPPGANTTRHAIKRGYYET